ncbi:MAG: hypothetical protein C0594_14425 [Marinilabiliales bacterium]|nr:MAG: hypothetical protein C0594_14425 [Marinilabiliales bacterium]
MNYDSLSKSAKTALAELQLLFDINYSHITKDKFGNLSSTIKTVKGHFSSLLCTSEKIDPRDVQNIIVACTDNTEDTFHKIIEHQDLKLSGLYDFSEESRSIQMLQNCIRCIHNLDVVNPYVRKVKIPSEIPNCSALNYQFQLIINQIALIHQYQRTKDKQGRIMVEADDIEMAIRILFDSIILNTDDLYPSLRIFFQQIKKIATESNTNYHFTQRELRNKLGLSKSSCFRFVNELEKLEYVKKVGGYANKGYLYKVVYWDDLEKKKKRIKSNLMKQLKRINKKD